METLKNLYVFRFPKDFGGGVISFYGGVTVSSPTAVFQNINKSFTLD